MLAFQPAQAARTPDYIGAHGIDTAQANSEKERKAYEDNALMTAGLDILTSMGTKGGIGMTSPLGWAGLAALAYDKFK